MPSPLGHAMAGAMTAWAAEAWARRSSSLHAETTASAIVEPGSGGAVEHGARSPNAWIAGLADLASPLAVTCAALAVLPDFDVFLHTHRTYSHSVGAAAIVWAVAALVAWRFRLPVIRTATVCAAAYASHVFLDWLGRDDSRLAGPMALWPLTTAHFKSGADLFLEFTLLHKRRFDPAAMFARNAPALIREVLILGGPFILTMALRLTARGSGNRGPAPDSWFRRPRPGDRLRSPRTSERAG